jgi:hypothetical protein
MASAYADAATKNALRARRAALPQFQPHDDGLRWNPSNSNSNSRSFLVTGMISDTSPHGWTLANDSYAMAQLRITLPSSGLSRDAIRANATRTFWARRHQIQAPGERTPFEGIGTGLVALWPPAMNTGGVDLIRDDKDEDEICSQLPAQIFGMSRNDIYNWHLTRQSDKHFTKQRAQRKPRT